MIILYHRLITLPNNNCHHSCTLAVCSRISWWVGALERWCRYRCCWNHHFCQGWYWAFPIFTVCGKETDMGRNRGCSCWQTCRRHVMHIISLLVTHFERVRWKVNGSGAPPSFLFGLTKWSPPHLFKEIDLHGVVVVLKKQAWSLIRDENGRGTFHKNGSFQRAPTTISLHTGAFLGQKPPRLKCKTWLGTLRVRCTHRAYSCGGNGLPVNERSLNNDKNKLLCLFTTSRALLALA